MSIDLAMDFLTGDLVGTANDDFAMRTGAEALQQRVHTTLMVTKGSWLLNPELGSRIADSLRSPLWRSPTEVELAVREALEEMGEVSVHEVTVDTVPTGGLVVHIKYAPSDQTAGGTNSISIPLGVGL